MKGVRLVVNLETTCDTLPVSGRHKYPFWTFDKTVPGPLIRARVGDTVEIRYGHTDTKTVFPACSKRTEVFLYKECLPPRLGHVLSCTHTETHTHTFQRHTGADTQTKSQTDAHTVARTRLGTRTAAMTVLVTTSNQTE